MRIIVTTAPFGKSNSAPMDLLKTLTKDYMFNVSGRKLTKMEHREMLAMNPEIIIAGTEHYGEVELSMCPNLKMISRVGIGTDSVDLKACEKRGILVTNTPDAPSNAVAELTICQMLNMLRKVQQVSNDLQMREKWNRYIGRELSGCTVGIIGCGRIGKLVARNLVGFGCKIKVTDIDKEVENDFVVAMRGMVLRYLLEDILESCDIITIHIPLEENKNFIRREHLDAMKPNVRVLNLSRGGIINEDDLYLWLKENPKACAAVDAFENEAYRGKLIKMGNAYLTPHMGSCTVKSRYDMELGAVQEAQRYIEGRAPCNRVV